MKKHFNNFAGFTLVELMVVVAIIGILATVAVPNFKRYQAKAKASEAKLILSSVYSAQTAFMGEWDSFATCIVDMGISAPAKGYYVFGFTTDSTANAAARGNGATCVDGVPSLAPANTLKVGGVSAVLADITAATVNTDGSTFKAGAAGKISADTAAKSLWHITENKILTNTTPGF